MRTRTSSHPPAHPHARWFLPRTAGAVTAAAVLAAGAWLAAPARAADIDVGVSIGISQPGVYGRIDIGRFPQPQVVYTQPVIVHAPPRVAVQPVYMWVPPGHRKNWKKHCGSYGACGVPVVFVRDDWYDAQVRPHDQKHKRGKGDRYDDGRGRGQGNGKGRD